MEVKKNEKEVDKNNKLFTWKEESQKILLLKEVIIEEPYIFKEGSKERGAAWTSIAKRLEKAGLKVTQRSVRDKFSKLLKDFQTREKEEQKASGVEVEFGEVEQLLTDITERMEEESEKRVKKDKTEKECAEEMRRKATESLSKTRKRSAGENSSSISDTEENEIAEPPKKKKSRNSMHMGINEIIKESLEVKKKEREEEQHLRAMELEFRKVEQEQQKGLMQCVIQQQQMVMQQQQAMNMAVINTLNEMLKTMKK